MPSPTNPLTTVTNQNIGSLTAVLFPQKQANPYENFVMSQEENVLFTTDQKKELYTLYMPW
jgi:hypothetical protein